MAIISGEILAYLTLIIFTIWTVLFFYFKHCHKYWERLGVPYVPPHFLYGSLETSIKQKRTRGENMVRWYNHYKAKGCKYLGLYLFNRPSLMIIDTGLVKNVMSKDFDHFVDRGVFYNEETDPLSAHLFSLEGMRWKHLRQKLTPTFTSGKLKRMFQTLVDSSEELKNCLDDYVTKDEAIDIKKIMAQYTTDVIGSCAFGIECNSFKNPNSDFTKLGAKIFNPDPIDRIKIIFSHLFQSASKLLKIRATSKEIDYFFRKLVKETVEYRQNNNITRNDFMQLLIQLKNKEKLDDAEDTSKKNAGDGLTMNEIAAQSFIFFVAGFETSSTTMTFCLYELAKNIDTQEKVRKDIISVLKKLGGKITYDSIMEMHYMERVILETLRKYPPLTTLQRKVTNDYKIPQTNIILKKNIIVFIPVLALHMDPDYYPEPDKFDPDRFTEENKATRPDFTYLPFGDGPRVCIGLRFGILQTKVGLCRLLCNYKFTLSQRTRYPMIIDPKCFILSAKDGIWLNAQKI